ncbi:MAG: phage distal tail protein [Brevinema sp.]
MFDKNLFDRNAYDRSVSSDGMVGSLYASGRMSMRVVIAYPLPLRSLTGSGDLRPNIHLRTDVGCNYESNGDLKSSEIRLRLPLQFRLQGGGNLTPGIVSRTPFASALFGSSSFTSIGDFVYQHMTFRPSGHGSTSCELVIKTPIDILNFVGMSGYENSIVLLLALTSIINGNGDFSLRRLGALNENIFELDGINLLPGERVIIDTDLLSVYFGYRQDVSSVTTDSVFFELSPGENDVVIETDAGEEINVTAIWQNRWL